MKHRLTIVVAAIAALVCLGASGLKQATPLTLVYPANFGNRTNIPDDNPMTEEGVQLGRRLFYETKLSINNLIACATCHQQAKAFTDGLRVSIGVDGTPTPRNAMSLVNLLWVRNFFWDGRAKGLEAQAAFPLTDPHEMGQSLEVSVQKLQQAAGYTKLFEQAFGSPQITEQRIVQALAQFERTLISANSKYDQYLRGDYQPTASELNGIQLFFSNPNPEKNIRGASCGHCHGGPKTYIELFHNNGLDSIPADKGREAITGQSYDRGRFRVATLRNIALTAPYMHDGRFSRLEDVVDHYNEHIQPSETLSTFLQGNQQGMMGDMTAAQGTGSTGQGRAITDGRNSGTDSSHRQRGKQGGSSEAMHNGVVKAGQGTDKSVTNAQHDAKGEYKRGAVGDRSTIGDETTERKRGGADSGEMSLQSARSKRNLQPGLTAQEKKDLLAFLHLLTDSSFIQDKRFSNPFIP